PRRAVRALALPRPYVLPAFRLRNGVSAQGMNLYEAQWLAYALPYRRFAAVLADCDARLGADMDRSGRTESPIIDSSRAAMSTSPSPRVDRLGTPKAPAIRFARAMTFVASWFTHLLRPARLLAPRYGSDHLRGQRGLLLPGFQRDEPVAGYNYSSDWTPLLTGLSPARMAASLAAPTPSS